MRKVAVTVLAGLLTFGGWSTFAAAGGDGPTLSVEPNPAEPGDELAVSGTGCPEGFFPEANAAQEGPLPDSEADAYLFDPEGVQVDASEGNAVAENGTWSTTLQLPGDAVEGDWQVRARCNPFATDVGLETAGKFPGEYDPVTVVVVAPEPEPEPQPDPEPEPEPEPEPTPPTVLPTETQRAPAAAPVAAQPAFTG